jgi:hypothetical protein
MHVPSDLLSHAEYILRLYHGLNQLYKVSSVFLHRKISLMFALARLPNPLQECPIS